MNDLNDGTGYLPQISQILINLTYDEIVDLIGYAITEDDLIRDITEAYFMGKESEDIDPKQTRREVMGLLIMAFRYKNSCFNARLKTPQEIPAATLATALSKTGYFARIQVPIAIVTAVMTQENFTISLDDGTIQRLPGTGMKYFYTLQVRLRL